MLPEFRKIPKIQIIMAFVATCIESAVRCFDLSYKEVYKRVKSVGTISKHYKYLHRQNIDYVATQFKETTSNDPTKSPVIQEIIMSNRIGAIAVELSKRLDIEPIEALQLFYESKTCENLHNKATGLYLYSDLYIVDDFIAEKRNN